MEGNDNGPLRMWIALRLLRAWNNGTDGYDGEVVAILNRWIDGGMQGPIPWPNNPFFREWAEAKGYSNVNGSVGFRFSAMLVQ
jgi:hypothetical protein